MKHKGVWLDEHTEGPRSRTGSPMVLPFAALKTVHTSAYQEGCPQLTLGRVPQVLKVSVISPSWRAT